MKKIIIILFLSFTPTVFSEEFERIELPCDYKTYAGKYAQFETEIESQKSKIQELNETLQEKDKLIKNYKEYIDELKKRINNGK